jgi:uncharacterized protein (UPF0262 family)
MSHILDLNVVGSSNLGIRDEVINAKHDLRDDTKPEDIVINGKPEPVKISIEVSAERRIEFIFAGKEIVVRKLIIDEQFYDLAESYKTSIEVYAAAIRKDSPEAIKKANAQRRELHNTGARLLAEHLRPEIVLSHDASRILFNLATHALATHALN